MCIYVYVYMYVYVCMYEGSLVSNLSVQVFYHMKKLLMTGKSSVEVKAPSETAAVDIVAREQDSPAGRRNKKIENTCCAEQPQTSQKKKE